MTNESSVPDFSRHKDWRLLEALLPQIRELQLLAEKHGVPDIFQDNGGKLLQLAMVTGLKLLRAREGNDAVDASGMEYELKTVNIRYAARRGARPQFTTHHHLNPTILNKYRQVHWLFATYDGIELIEIFFMTADKLEPLFTTWENKWHESGGRDINNPKIPMLFVHEHGTRIFQARR